MWPKILLTNKNVLVFVLSVAAQIQQEFFSSLWCQVFALCLNMIAVRFVVLVYSADFVNYLNNKQHDVFWHHKSLGQNL
jgi:threonine/homoserine/homoserine lactone efflux protein